MQRKFFTVVFEVHDQAKFASAVGQFTHQMAADDQAADKQIGHSITACGWGDFATQAEAFQAETDNDGKSALSILQAFLEPENPGLSSNELLAKAKAVLGE